MIDNFPHEAAMRERVHELMRTYDTEWSIELVETILSIHGFNRVISFSRNSSVITGHKDFDESVLRIIYERDSDERVEDWDQHHADMFKLCYGFDLYP